MRHESGSFVARESSTLQQLALSSAYSMRVCAYLVGEGSWDPCGRAPPASEDRLEGPAVGNKGFMEAELPVSTASKTPINKSLAHLRTYMQLLLATSMLRQSQQGPQQLATGSTVRHTPRLKLAYAFGKISICIWYDQNKHKQIEQVTQQQERLRVKPASEHT